MVFGKIRIRNLQEKISARFTLNDIRNVYFKLNYTLDSFEELNVYRPYPAIFNYRISFELNV